MVMDTIKVGVGVCTRNRPHMFKALLEDLAKQKMPNGAEVTFIFVENDTEVGIAKTVDEFREALIANGTANPKICVEPEPQIGISFAKNRILEIALHFDLDFLANPDDDDYPANENWLCELLNGIHTRHLDLAYGLHRIEPISKKELASFGFIQKLVYRARANHLRSEKRLLTYHRDGHNDKIYSGGSSAIYRLSLVREHKIRFNTNLRMSGGEDREIYLDIKATGGKVGLVPSAVAYERVRPERLTLHYVFTLQRVGCLTRYGKRYQTLRQSKPRNFGLIFYAFAKFLLGTIRLLLVPATGGRSLVDATKSFGSLTGLIEGQFHRENKHYAKTDGE